MLRTIMRVLAILVLLGGLCSSVVAGFLLLTPSDEETLFEQKTREASEKYQQAQRATNVSERTRLLNESQEAARSARAWGEGARTRRAWYQAGMGAGIGSIFFGIVVFVLSFFARKREVAPAPAG
jgi:hypothetical protein